MYSRVLRNFKIYSIERDTSIRIGQQYIQAQGAAKISQTLESNLKNFSNVMHSICD